MSISILTWNVCFGCMYSNDKSKYDATARTLALHCEAEAKLKHKNVCLANVSQYISKKPYDFIGLQEATNWSEIYKHLSSVFPNMSYLHSRLPAGGAFAGIITFYNSSKYKILYAKVGNIKPTDARPYQILFFNEIATGNKFIVINLHNEHHATIAELESKLSSGLENSVDLTLEASTNFENLNDKGTTDIRKFILANESNFNVCAMEDFNDHGYGNFWRGLSPFKNVGWLTALSPLKKLLLKATSVPNSCCVGTHSLRYDDTEDPLYGDYVLIDDSKFNFIVQNTIPITTEFQFNAHDYPTSDHLPVNSVIELKKPVVPVPAPPVPAPPIPAPPVPAPPVVPVPKSKPKPKSKPVLPIIFPPVAKPVLPIISPPVVPPALPVRAPVPPAPIIFKLNTAGSKTLRLLDSPLDPNVNPVLNGKNFKGATINLTDRLIYPNGKASDNSLVLVVDFDNPNIFGYVRSTYLTLVDPALKIFSINKPSITLRLCDDLEDPNKTPVLNGNPHRGETITSTNRLVYPNGQITANNYVLVQKESDRNVYGYVNNSYLSRVHTGSAYLEKYLKYKNKYLNLKKRLNYNE